MNTARLMGTGVISAVAASLCCIMPVLALVAGSSSIASNFTWIEPARPYLIGVTIAVLGFAWYQKLKPQPVDECGCAPDEKPKFFHSKTFLLIVTVFAVLMMAFPYYAKAFFPKNDKLSVVTVNSKTETAEFGIKGMTCEACEEHVKMEVNKLPGIVSVSVSYAKHNATVRFNPEKTNAKEITKAINSTGYKVISQTSKN
jgi:mercuric ion transport protein